MRVLIASDKFKGSLTAAEVTESVEAGLRRAVPDGLQVDRIPVADGGEGTLEAALAAGFERVPVTASGPTGEAVHTAFAVRGSSAVVELAAICGLARLPGGRLDPLGSSSAGLGEVIRTALERGCRTIIVGSGGSASTDGGAGMLQALGAVLRDADGRVLSPFAADLERACAIELSGLHPAVSGATFVVACDVDNPLCGDTGAAAVYGPQKGATAEQVGVLDRRLRRWADLVATAIGTDRSAAPGAGSAGGVGFAALAVLGASLRPGIELVLELVGFQQRLAGADLVITGEGSLDQQTLHGKAPAGVASAARAAGVPVAAVAGRVLLGAAALAAAGISRAYPLTDLEPDQATSMATAGPLLQELAVRIAHDFLTPAAGAGHRATGEPAGA